MGGQQIIGPMIRIGREIQYAYAGFFQSIAGLGRIGRSGVRQSLIVSIPNDIVENILAERETIAVLLMVQLRPSLGGTGGPPGGRPSAGGAGGPPGGRPLVGSAGELVSRRLQGAASVACLQGVVESEGQQGLLSQAGGPPGGRPLGSFPEKKMQL